MISKFNSFFKLLYKYKLNSFGIIKNRIISNFYFKFNIHPSSEPFLSGDTYKSFADHYFHKNCKNLILKDYDIIFLSLYEIDYFMQFLEKNIKTKFILVTHHSDLTVDDKYLNLVNNSLLIKWYAQNNNLNNPKVISLPIGLEDRWRCNAGDTLHISKLILKTKNIKKTSRILYGFNVLTNLSERIHAKNYLEINKLADKIDTTSYLYRQELIKYMFVASPPGNGPDCHRTWEAIYLNVVPIVIKNPIYDQFLDLPIWFIDDWSDLLYLTEDQLAYKYFYITSNCDSSKAYSDFWKTKFSNRF